MSQAAIIPTNSAPYAGLPEINQKLFDAKAKKGTYDSLVFVFVTAHTELVITGLSFEALAKELGKDEVWVASAFYGQAKFTNEELQKLSQVLGLDESSLVAVYLNLRGCGDLAQICG
ncbi:hypothetical protein D9758_014518 [Tetrapyrgos nigripes]|uniref:Uncharacterized protein n=1 Tax=Tetrapyrgos nigripes TaxID=182062 RepID=A0A8H5CUX3_9AGAR|nr:hypothetical protein D9758_014518 [Tetrapyrgos nigripes]